ncbi:MAG: protein MpaA [Ilumatobacter sp.]
MSATLNSVSPNRHQQQYQQRHHQRHRRALLGALVLVGVATAGVTSHTNALPAPPDTAVSSAASIDAPAERGDQVEVIAPRIVIGTSIEGRAIVAERMGVAGGRKVLVIGVIHGNEDAGIQVVDELRRRAIDERVELWLIDSMNPDGVARQDRHNSNEVDLNRNFPYKWGPIGQPGNSQYAGTGPASEPETRAAVSFITWLRPDIVLWYHQDANLIIPSTGRDGRIRARYAELTALPLADCCGGGGVYTGIAATWAKNELKKDSDAVAFIVELPGGSLDTQQVNAHANAVLTIGIEG